MPNLITKARIVVHCGLNDLVEERKLAPWIKEAHRTFRKKLGWTLYNALLTAVAADANLSDPANARFEDLMAEDKGCGEQYLCWQALALSYISLHSEADKAGVFSKSGEDYSAVSISELKMKIAQAESMAGNFQEELLLWLKDHKNDYPEWRETGTRTEQRIDEHNAQQVAGLGFRRAKRQQQYRG